MCLFEILCKVRAFRKDGIPTRIDVDSNSLKRQISAAGQYLHIERPATGGASLHHRLRERLPDFFLGGEPIACTVNFHEIDHQVVALLHGAHSDRSEEHTSE